MKLQKPYLVDGEVFYLDDEQAETARQQATDAGATFEDAQTVSLDGNDFTVPVSQYDAVLAQAKEAGSVAQPRTFVQMDDGERLALNGNDVASMVNRRRYGYGISRNDFKKLGIPDWYARGEGDRMALTDQLGDLVAPEDPELRATRIKQLVEGYGGNIDHNGRPMLLNADENGRITGYSTTSSTVVQDDDGKFVVVPTVVTDADGNAVRLDTPEEALAHYRQTGEFYGKFGSEARAADAANNIHSMHQDLYKGKWNDLVHENWDAMSDEIRNDPGTAEEHQRRLQVAESKKPGIVKRAIDEVMFAPGSESRKWMDEGAESGEMLPTTVKNLQGYSGRIASGVANLLPAATDVLGEALGGENTSVGRYFKDSARAGREAIAGVVDTELPDLATGDENFDKLFNKANEFVGDTGATLIKFSIPGAAAVDISANAANAYYDAYRNAKKSGMTDAKAEALAAAKSGISAVEGIILAKSAAGTGGVKGFFKRALSVAGKMGGAAAANDLVDQCISGAENLNIRSAAIAGLKGAAEGAAFEGYSALAHRLTPTGMAQARQNRESKKAQEIENEVEEAVKRGMKRGKAEAEAEARYNRTMDAETAYNLDADISTLVETGAVPEAARETVKKRVIENAGDNLRTLEDAEARETAVITAADQITGEKNARRDADAANKEVYRRQKAEMEEYQAQEEARKAREAASEAEPAAPEAPKAEVPTADEPQFPTRENRLAFSPEYAEWLNKNGRNDTDKNWNRFIAENELPDAWKARNEEKDARIEQQRQQADDAATEAELRRGEAMRRKAEEERVRREEEAKAAAEQAAYDEKMARREEERANETPSPESQMEMTNEAEGKRRLMTKEEADAYREGRERAAEEAEADVSLEQNERLRAEFETAKDRDAFASKHAAWMKENGIPEYGEFLERNGIQPSKVAKLAYDRAVARAMGVEVPPLTPAESAEIKSDLDRRVAEWQARKDAAKAKGDPFKEPKPTAQQMEFDFGKPPVAQNAPKTPQEASTTEPVHPTETLAETSAETPVAAKYAKATEAQPAESTEKATKKPADTPSVSVSSMDTKTAAKILGADAYDKKKLTAKLWQWESHPTAANAKHREAAKAMLGMLEGEREPQTVGDVLASPAVAESPAEPETLEAPITRLSQAEPSPDFKASGVRPWYKRIFTPLRSSNGIVHEARKLFPEFAFREQGTRRMPEWTAGHWEPDKSLIRSKDITSIKTISHEIGHGIDQWTRKNSYLKGARPSAEVSAELEKLGKDLYGTKKPNGGYEAEGFAEFIMGTITGQDTATLAPKTTAWFRGEFAKANPKMFRRVEKLRGVVDGYRGQSPQEVIRGFQKSTESTLDKVVSGAKDLLSEERWSDDLAPLRRGFEKAGVRDALYRWQDDCKALEKLAKQGKLDTPEAKRLQESLVRKVTSDPYLFASNVRGTQSQRTMDMARHGTTNLMGTDKIGNVILEGGKVKLDKDGNAVRDNVTEGLRDIFRGWSDETNVNFRDYAVAKAGLENYYAKGKQFGVPRKVCEAVVKEFETPEFEDALKRTSDYAHRVLSNGVEAGYMTWDTYAKIVRENPYYVRITRRMTDDVAKDWPVGESGNPVNRRTGGNRNILPVVDALMMDTDRMMGRFFSIATQKRIIEGVLEAQKLGSFKNGDAYAIAANLPIRVPNEQEGITFTSEKIRKDFMERAKRHFEESGELPEGYTFRNGKMVTAGEAAAEELYESMYGDEGAKLTIFRERPARGKGGRISAYVGGKLTTFEVPDAKWMDLLDSIETKSEMNGLEKFFNAATAGVRFGATTLNNEFALRNAIRDTLHAAIMSETGALPLVSTARGIVHDVIGTDVATLFKQMGGEMSGLIGMSKEMKWKNAGRIATVGAKGNPESLLVKAGDKVLEVREELKSNFVKGLTKEVADVLQIPETGPRIREFEGTMNRLAKVGVTGDAAKMLALAQSQDISINFKRAGTAMRSLNHYIPFSNATFRGTEQFLRNLGALSNLPHQFETSRGKRFAKTVAKGVAELTTFSLGQSLYQMMTMSDEERKREFERSAVEKWDYANVFGIRVPLPFEAGLMFYGLPKALVYEAYGDKGAVSEWARHTLKALPTKYLDPSGAISSIAGISPFIEIMRNEKWNKSPVVSPVVKDSQLRKDWYDFATTTPAKLLGELTHNLLGADKAVPPAYTDHILNSFTGGMWMRALSPSRHMLSNPLETFKERKGDSRLVESFYGEMNLDKQKYGSREITPEEYGKYREGEKLKDVLSEDFKSMRALRDADMSDKERDRKRIEIMVAVNGKIRAFNERSDFSGIGVAHAAEALSNAASSDERKENARSVLKDVSLADAKKALAAYGREIVTTPVKNARGQKTGRVKRHRRWTPEGTSKRLRELERNFNRK